MGWEAEAEEIRVRLKRADEMGGSDAVSKQHKRGFHTVRERIAGIVDRGTFHEIDRLAGKGTYENGELVSVRPAPYVMGIAEIDGRSVAIGGEDTTVRGGTSWGENRRKGRQGGFIDDLA